MKMILSIAALFLAGCASVSPQSLAQSVFAAKATYAAALSVAVQYKALPACPQPTPICSDKAVVAKLQAADNIAAPALNSAEAAVRNPDFGKDALSTAVIAANNAVSALTAITSTLKVK